MESAGVNADDPGLRLGKRAVERGLITPDELNSALTAHPGEPVPGQDTASRLGSILVDKGYLTSTQLAALIRETESQGSAAKLGTFGKFQLLSEVGHGGMGVVYEARDQDLDRRVALKLLLSSRNAPPQEAVLDEERFIREARLSARVKHPHIVTVFEAGAIDGRRYIAMEFVEGLPFSEWRRKGSITVRQLVAILRDVALALHQAHEQGIIHRDLKPANVLVDTRNEPHVTDFGLAKFVGQNVALSFSAEGRVVGTPTHMSPEQVRGSKSIDRRADIYSLGVMLYEIMTGRLPFEGDSAMEIMMKVVNEPVRPPSKITTLKMNPIVFTSLEAICLRAMQKNPRDRYADARVLAEDLTSWLEGQAVKARAPRLGRLAAWIAAGAAALALGAGAWHFYRPAPPPDVPLAAVLPPPPSPVPADLEIVFEPTPRARGIRIVDLRGDRSENAVMAGKPCVKLLPHADRPFRQIHFDLDDSWPGRSGPLDVEVEYFDGKEGRIHLEYDSADKTIEEQSYKSTEKVKLAGTGTWKTASFRIDDPRFENRQSKCADFRIETRDDLHIHRVAVRRR